jgi:hypothetical protein
MYKKMKKKIGTILKSRHDIILASETPSEGDKQGNK